MAEAKAESASPPPTVVDSHLAVNMLPTTAKRLNGEFQNHMRALLICFGVFMAGSLNALLFG